LACPCAAASRRPATTSPSTRLITGCRSYAGESPSPWSTTTSSPRSAGLLTDLKLDTTPSIANTDAEALARADLGLPADAPIVGETTLMVFDLSLIEDVAPDPHLVWRVTFGSVPAQVFVDAHTGKVAHKIQLTENNAGRRRHGPGCGGFEFQQYRQLRLLL